MATTTSALPDGTKLTKPAYSDSADIAVINTNMDNIANNIIAMNNTVSTRIPSTVLFTENQTFTINFANNGRHFIVLTAANAPVRAAVWVVSVANSGDITYLDIKTGTGITVDTTTANKIIVTQNTSTRTYVVDFALSGDFVTIT